MNRDFKTLHDLAVENDRNILIGKRYYDPLEYNHGQLLRIWSHYWANQKPTRARAVCDMIIDRITTIELLDEMSSAARFDDWDAAWRCRVVECLGRCPTDAEFQFVRAWLCDHYLAAVGRG